MAILLHWETFCSSAPGGLFADHYGFLVQISFLSFLDWWKSGSYCGEDKDKLDLFVRVVGKRNWLIHWQHTLYHSASNSLVSIFVSLCLDFGIDLTDFILSDHLVSLLISSSCACLLLILTAVAIHHSFTISPLQCKPFHKSFPPPTAGRLTLT